MDKPRYTVLIQRDDSGRYVASLVERPEVCATAPSSEDALSLLSVRLIEADRRAREIEMDPEHRQHYP